MTMMASSSSRATSLATASSLHSGTLLFPSLSSCLHLQFPKSSHHGLCVSQSPAHSTAKVSSLPILDTLQDGLLTEADESDSFIEVGLIRSTHGVGGELKATSRTDFPELRFEQPGIRWVGFYRMGKFVGIREVNLISGRRIIQGKGPAWLLRFEGFETMEKATELLGATILVKNTDRPALTDGQFYIPDLIGMSVQLKESGEVIGNVVDIFNSGASDLLRVKMFPSRMNNNAVEEAKENLVWIPFAEEIVPVVDRQSRHIEIVPPKGLLELNLPTQKPLKQQLRKEALKAKRKLQERLSGVRKRLAALNQGHVLSGLSLGDEHQKESLRTQLVNIDFKLFKHAVESSLKYPELHSRNEICILPAKTVHSIDWKGLKKWSNSLPKELQYSAEVNQSTWSMWQRGIQLVAEGKVAIVILLDNELVKNEASFKSTLKCQIQQLLAIQDLPELISEETAVVPLVLVTTEASEEHIKQMLVGEAYFGLPESQVILVKSSCLPYVSCDAKENTYKILMESDWKLTTGPGGEGHAILDLDDSGVLNHLIQMGVQYIHVCGMDKSSISSIDSVLFGLMDEAEADVAVMVTTTQLEKDDLDILCLQKSDLESSEIGENSVSTGNYTISRRGLTERSQLTSSQEHSRYYKVSNTRKYTYTVEHLLLLSKQRYGFLYDAMSAPSAEGKCINVDSNGSNVIQLKCSLNSSLLFCPASKVALVESNLEV